MKQTKLIMGMPITINIVDPVTQKTFNKIFSYFRAVDKKFSTYKKDSEISKINDLRIKIKDSSKEMQMIFKLAEKAKRETGGYFNIYHNGKYDPSGIVKGWAIYKACKILEKDNFKNFYVDAGGDIQVKSEKGEVKREKLKKWKVGIKNPFDQGEIVKIVYLTNEGIATSGTYIRGSHIYNPKGEMTDDVASLTVIGLNVYEADRFATAAFAMGKNGIEFIEKLPGFEGYMIDQNGIATFTTGFEKYTIEL